MVHAGPSVPRRQRHRLLAAFNGGFKLSAGAGGYEQEGHVISRLRRGLASLVIDRSGQASIGVWGKGLPRPGEAVFSVRQNLTPLVARGRIRPAARHWARWGATITGGEFVARSADINPEWVQLDTARKAGGRLRAAIPGQVRPANQYLAGWRRDFFAVVAAP